MYQDRLGIQRIRLYLALLVVLFITTLLYLVVDVVVINIPDPTIPYIFYILIITILFGLRTAFITTIVTAGLLDYYLFEPRYIIFVESHRASEYITLFGLFISLIIGDTIRRYQLSLIKGSDDLKLLLKARDQFASITAHDLKNPLTTIKLYAEILDKKYGRRRPGKQLHDSVTTIGLETDKLLEMVNRLLDFSRIQTGKMRLNLEQIDIVSLCRRKIKVFQHTHPDFKIEFIPKVKKAFVLGDLVSLDRVITNLLSNAVKYSSEKKEILLTLTKRQKNIILQIKDRGIGVDENKIKNLFDPFYQTSDTNEGLGLGLYISKTIVERHKGTIWVTSKKGKGSSFFISIPSIEPKK